MAVGRNGKPEVATELTTVADTSPSQTGNCRCTCGHQAAPPGGHFNNAQHRVDSVVAKIGHGVVLSRESVTSGLSMTSSPVTSGSERSSTVWMYNCGEFPVFVDSRLLRRRCRSLGSRRSSTSASGRADSADIFKLHPGHSVCVYDRREASAAAVQGGDVDGEATPWPAVNGPVGFDSVIVSFVKGWGRKYKRQTITQCPCWLDILIDESCFVD